MMKMKQRLASLVLLLFAGSAFAQDAAEKGGAITGRIVGPILIALLIWQVIKHANKKAAYQKQLAERRKIRAAQERAAQEEASKPK